MAPNRERRLTTEEILAQIPAARERGEAERAQGRRAVDASYDLRRRELRLGFPNGASVGIPVALIAALEGAPAGALREVEVTASGAGLHFESLDVDLSVPALLVLALRGTPATQALGALAGSSTSERKAAASRLNGAKGGRPRKPPGEAGRSIEERRSGPDRRQSGTYAERSEASGGKRFVRVVGKKGKGVLGPGKLKPSGA